MFNIQEESFHEGYGSYLKNQGYHDSFLHCVEIIRLFLMKSVGLKFYNLEKVYRGNYSTGGVSEITVFSEGFSTAWRDNRNAFINFV